jgi:predicted RNA-binding protein YlqC (UPF0109 family)
MPVGERSETNATMNELTKISAATIAPTPSTEPAMKELVQFLAQQLVNNPDAVEVKETRSDTASVLELRVAKEDLGWVIGMIPIGGKPITRILPFFARLAAGIA